MKKETGPHLLLFSTTSLRIGSSTSLTYSYNQEIQTTEYFTSTHFHCAPETVHLKCCALDCVIISIISTILNATNFNGNNTLDNYHQKLVTHFVCSLYFVITFCGMNSTSICSLTTQFKWINTRNSHKNQSTINQTIIFLTPHSNLEVSSEEQRYVNIP